MMFWNNLTNSQADRYYHLLKIIGPWIAWSNLSKTKKAETTEPYKPTDDELSDMELLAMDGWRMRKRCPWSGEICECEPKDLGFPWTINGKIPDRCKLP